jgi:hypothetical protein
MADYFGPPKISFDNFDPIGSYQKGQKFGLENRARSELAKCKPDDFACMTRVLQGLDPELAVRAQQVQGQLQHQKIMEGQGAEALNLRRAESAAEDARAAAAAGTRASEFERTASQRDEEIARAKEATQSLTKQRQDEVNREISPVVSLMGDYRTARDDIEEGGWALGSTRQRLTNFAAAIGMAIGDKNPQNFAQANVPGVIGGTEDAKKVLKGLESYLPAIAARSAATGLPYTPEQFKVPEYVSKEKQAGIDRNPPTERDADPGSTAPPLPPSAAAKGISPELWAASPRLWNLFQ